MGRAFGGREVCADRYLLPLRNLFLEVIQLLAETLHRKLAQQQMPRRLGRTYCRNNRLHRALRIAGLLAGLCPEVLARLAGSLVVVGDGGARLHARAAEKVRAERPRLHDRHRNSKRLQLARQRLAHALDRKLRRVVHAPPSQPDQPADRGQVDDVARPARAKLRQQRLGHPNQPEDIGLEELVQLLPR